MGGVKKELTESRNNYFKLPREVKLMHEKLVELSKSLKERFKDEVENVIVFGSYARGDFTDDSDIDILVVVKDDKIEKDVRKVAYSFIPKVGRLISVKVIRKGMFERMKKMNFSLIASIEKEGVAIE